MNTARRRCNASASSVATGRWKAATFNCSPSFRASLCETRGDLAPKLLGSDRLYQVSTGAFRDGRVLEVILEVVASQHADGNVRRPRVLLELPDRSPAVHRGHL